MTNLPTSEEESDEAAESRQSGHRDRGEGRADGGGQADEHAFPSVVGQVVRMVVAGLHVMRPTLSICQASLAIRSPRSLSAMSTKSLSHRRTRGPGSRAHASLRSRSRFAQADSR